jgi:hypothetical protein
VLSLPIELQKTPHARKFRTILQRMHIIRNCVAEGSEFELPVPVSKLSNDSIMLEFATARRIALIARRLQYWRALLGVQGKHFAQRYARYHPAR